MYSKRKELYTKVYKKLPTKMNKKDSTKQCTVQRIAAKFEREEQRYKIWRFFTPKPGVSYTKETGLLQTETEEQWQSFCTEFGGDRPQKSHWLIEKPLGDMDTFEALFVTELAMGSSIVSIDDRTADRTSREPKVFPEGSRPF